MVRIVRIGRPPYAADLLEDLHAAGALYHADATLDGFRSLVDSGLDVRAVEEDVPDGATLLLPVATGPLERLIQIADRLLAPDGCPWDREQTHATLKRYLLEETYELFQAIDDEDAVAMREELGDVLLQPVMHAAMQKRDGSFDIDAVADSVSDKLVRRHPHVFGDVEATNSDEVLKNWDAIKRSEGGETPKSVLEGVPRATPSLLRAYEISKRAARCGFEWPNVESVWAKFDEERAELSEALRSGDASHIQAELGDLFFTLVNVARWLKVEPELALASMIDRFIERFKTMETLSPVPLDMLTLDQWDELWERAKAQAAN